MSDFKGDVQYVLKAGSEAKILGLLGFAARARKLVCGTDLCRDEVRRGKLPLVLVAGDASDNTKKRISDACKYYGTDFCIVPITSDELSARIGKTGSIAVIGITDMSFVNGIAAHLERASH